MPTEPENGHWIPLVEFSVRKGISLSTLRRYIKSNKIPWKLLEGRYLVLDDGSFTAPRNHEGRLSPAGAAARGAGHFPASASIDTSADTDPATTHPATEERLRLLEQDLNAAYEEIAELKTLVAFYEEKWAQISKK